MEEKKLLDKDGKEITKERIEEVMKEVYKDTPPLLEKCEWEEDGQVYHTWKINAGKHESGRQVTGYTNDAGAAQIQKALEEWIKENYGTEKKSNKKNR